VDEATERVEDVLNFAAERHVGREGLRRKAARAGVCEGLRRPQRQHHGATSKNGGGFQESEEQYDAAQKRGSVKRRLCIKNRSRVEITRSSAEKIF